MSKLSKTILHTSNTTSFPNNTNIQLIYITNISTISPIIKLIIIINILSPSILFNQDGKKDLKIY